MNKKEENNSKITNYLEGNLSADEEVSFMQQLGNDALLREQYEEELLISGLLRQQEKDDALINLFSHTDDKTTTGDNMPAKKKSAVKELWINYRNIAAIVLVIVAASFIFLFIRKSSKPPAGIANTAKDTALRTADRAMNITRDGKKNTDSVFKEMYSAYIAGEEDPVEVSEFYEAYRGGRYAKVLSATKEDDQQMGAGNKNSEAERYMDLYKGLAYLGSNKPDSAISKLDAVMRKRSKTSKLYYDAQWYVALAWLKKKETGQALMIAKDIWQSASPYKLKAEQLVKYLSN